jgi:alcohol dehydrogenase
MSSNIILPLPFKISRFYITNKILFGIDASNEVVKEIAVLTESKNTLIVTDKNIKNLEKFNEILSILEKERYSYTIFDGVEPEPTIVTVRKLCSLARELKPSVIIGIGGGSVMDSSKMASISLTNPKPVDDYVGLNVVERKGKPLICIPTTAGTGSEVTMYAVFTMEDHSKKTMVSPYIIPDTAIVDPKLTLTCPKRITAGAGMDALAHAIEAMISLEATPLTDMFALESVKLIFKYLRRAYYKGNDIEARYYMAMAATLAGVSLCNARVVLGHTISQAFAPFCNMPHGTSAGMALPFAMEFYLPVMQEKFAEIARVIGLAKPHMSIKEKAEKAIEGVKELAKDIELPTSLKDVGIKEEQFEEIVEIGLRNWPRPNSPIELSKEKVVEFIRRMWEGY